MIRRIAPLALLGALSALAGCGAPPTPLPTAPPAARPSNASSAPVIPTAPTLPTAGAGATLSTRPTATRATTGPPPTTSPISSPPPPGAPLCTAGPTGTQVLTSIESRPGLPPGASLRVDKGPFCASTWQFTIVGLAGRDPGEVEPLLVVTTGKPDALTVVEAGTAVCTPTVVAQAPPGIRVRACGS